jgi:hypothetical protein
MDALSSIFTWLSDHEAGISAVVGIAVLAGIVFAGVRSLLHRADRGFERVLVPDKRRSVKFRGEETLSLVSEPPLAELAPTMVGRADQEARMRSVFETAAQGHARLLCLTGEPGIGKSTLAQDFLGRLRDEREPCLIARGRCSERLAGTEAYLPVMEMLESLLRSGNGERLAETMKQLAPTWYFRIVPLGADDASDSRLRDDARVASQ